VRSYASQVSPHHAHRGADVQTVQTVQTGHMVQKRRSAEVHVQTVHMQTVQTVHVQTCRLCRPGTWVTRSPSSTA